MAQRTSPICFRTGINRNWSSRWSGFEDKDLSKMLVQDEKIRKYFYANFNASQIVNIEIERKTSKNSFDKERKSTIDVLLYCGQLGLFDDETNKKIVNQIQKIVGRSVKINFVPVEYSNVWWSARVVARKIADDIENRVPFRVAQKNAIKNVMIQKALGVKTVVGGRLNGVDMARTEWYSEGTIPTSTIRCDLDYAHEIAQTPKGSIGVKVWINRGEIFEKGLNNQITPVKYAAPVRRGYNNNRPNDKKGATK